MTNQGVFVLGMGAQKAGTSWLHWYLQKAPNVDCGPRKEYHIWDAATLPDLTRGKVSDVQAKCDEVSALRWRMQQDPEAYFAYFAARLTPSEITVTADMTPLYAALSTETLRTIREGFEARQIGCRAVFLMRDPLDRLWSAARMIHQNEGRSIQKQLPSPEAYLEEIYASRVGQVRTRYDLTVGRLEQVFAPQDLFLGLYEEMFDPDPLARLSEFCGVTCRPELTQQRVRQGAKETALPQDLAQQVAQAYAPVYAFCAQRWPQVQNLWSGFAYL